MIRPLAAVALALALAAGQLAAWQCETRCAHTAHAFHPDGCSHDADRGPVVVPAPPSHVCQAIGAIFLTLRSAGMTMTMPDR